MPWASAYDDTYSSPTKKPHSMKKTPAVTRQMAGLHRILKSGRMLWLARRACLRNLLRGRTMTQPTRSSTMVMRPMTRVVQANPSRSPRASNTSGNMTPPRLPPDMASPVAAPRLTLKYCPMVATGTTKTMDVAAPATMPTTTIKCQYA